MNTNEKIPVALALQLQLPKQRTKMVLYLYDLPVRMVEFLHEHLFLLDECEIHMNKSVPELDFYKGALLIDHLHEIRYKEKEVDYFLLSSNLQSLISACGCDASDQW